MATTLKKMTNVIVTFIEYEHEDGRETFETKLSTSQTVRFDKLLGILAHAQHIVASGESTYLTSGTDD